MKKEILAVIAVITAILVALFAGKKTAAPTTPGAAQPISPTEDVISGATLPVATVCKEGSFRCSGTTKQQCVSNRWVTYRRNATECGYVGTKPTTPEETEVTPKETVVPTPDNVTDPATWSATCPPNVYDVKYLERVPFPGQPGMYSSVYITKTVLATTSDAAAAALGLRAGFNCFVSKNSAASATYHTSGVLPAGTIVAGK